MWVYVWRYVVAVAAWRYAVWRWLCCCCDFGRVCLLSTYRLASVGQFLFQGKGEAMVSPLQCSGFALSGLEPHAGVYRPMPSPRAAL